MRELLRRGDPAFYDKEPILLRTGVQIPRYDDEAQLAARLKVLGDDRLLHHLTVLVALVAFAAVTGFGSLGARGDWPALCAFAVLTVAGPRALPWWPPLDRRATWRHALIVLILILLCGAWTHLTFLIGGFAVASALATYLARESNRLVLLALAAAVLFAHALFSALVPAVIAAAVFGVSSWYIAREWRRRSQAAFLGAFAILLLACAYVFAFDSSVLTWSVSAEIAAIALAYLGICLGAARVQRADVAARPEGLVSLPQTIVPLLDRSHHHAIIVWRV